MVAGVWLEKEQLMPKKQTFSHHFLTWHFASLSSPFLSLQWWAKPGSWLFPWWRTHQRQACANRAAWANSLSTVCLSACLPPGARKLAVGEQRHSSQCQSRQRAHWQLFIWVGSALCTRPEKCPQRRGADKAQGWVTCPRQKAWGAALLVPRRHFKTWGLPMKSYQQQSRQRPWLPTVIYSKNAVQTHRLIMGKQRETLGQVHQPIRMQGKCKPDHKPQWLEKS